MVGQASDLFMLLILVLLTAVVALGARIGLRALWIMVAAKLLAIGAVIVVGAMHIDVANFAASLRRPIPPRHRRGRPAPVLGIVVGQSERVRLVRHVRRRRRPSPSPTSASTSSPPPPRRP